MVAHIYRALFDTSTDLQFQLYAIIFHYAQGSNPKLVIFTDCYGVQNFIIKAFKTTNSLLRLMEQIMHFPGKLVANNLFSLLW